MWRFLFSSNGGRKTQLSQNANIVNLSHFWKQWNPTLLLAQVFIYVKLEWMLEGIFPYYLKSWILGNGNILHRILYFLFLQVSPGAAQVADCCVDALSLNESCWTKAKSWQYSSFVAAWFSCLGTGFTTYSIRLAPTWLGAYLGGEGQLWFCVCHWRPRWPK